MTWRQIGPLAVMLWVAVWVGITAANEAIPDIKTAAVIATMGLHHMACAIAKGGRT